MATSPPRALSTTVVAVALALAAAGGSAASSGSTSAPVSTARLQPLPSLDHSGHGHRLVTVASAAGRAWFAVGSLRGLTVVSARASGRRLASLVTTRVQAPLSWYPLVVGSDLLYSTTRSSAGVAPLGTAGKVGAADAASPDPMASKLGIPVAAARLRDRLIWALAGGVRIGDGLNFRPTLAVCCTASGSPVDLTSLITSRPAPRDHVLGVDARGRPWLAWLDRFGPRAQVRIVRLDPTTLARTTRKALVAPVARPSALRLACAATCRLALQASERDPRGGYSQFIATWAPGEKSSTRVRVAPVLKEAQENPQLVAASYRSGRLAVAYLQQTSVASRALNVVVGDARGNRARLRGSVELPERYSGLPMWSLPLGAFAPRSFVAALAYSTWGSKVRVVATAVPLG
jgi:hypothetical protein